MANNNKVRTRNFASVVYPESAPDNWLDLLIDSHIPFFVSPLHDKDLNADGSPKKPHYHVMTMYDNVKTFDQAREVFQSFGGVGCEVINSLRAYARYLCHLDNPEKAQYNIEDVKQGGGSDYILVIGCMSDKNNCIREMKKYVRENKVFYFCDLFDYADDNNSMWFDCLINSGSFIMKEYIKSYTFKYQTENGCNYN